MGIQALSFPPKEWVVLLIVLWHATILVSTEHNNEEDNEKQILFKKFWKLPLTFHVNSQRVQMKEKLKKDLKEEPSGENNNEVNDFVPKSGLSYGRFNKKSDDFIADIEKQLKKEHQEAKRILDCVKRLGRRHCHSMKTFFAKPRHRQERSPFDPPAGVTWQGHDHYGGFNPYNHHLRPPVNIFWGNGWNTVIRNVSKAEIAEFEKTHDCDKRYGKNYCCPLDPPYPDDICIPDDHYSKTWEPYFPDFPPVSSNPCTTLLCPRVTERSENDARIQRAGLANYILGLFDPRHISGRGLKQTVDKKSKQFQNKAKILAHMLSVNRNSNSKSF